MIRYSDATSIKHSAEEGVLHYLKDGLVLAHVAGLSGLGGTGNLGDYGHFRVTGTLELAARNATGQQSLASIAVPSAMPVADGKQLALEPVRLSKDDLHHLMLSSDAKVRRSGTCKITSPFGGVSFDRPSKGLLRAYVQYDPQRSGWNSALLVTGPGVSFNKELTKGLSFREFEAGSVVEGTGGTTPILVLEWEESLDVNLASRPTQG